MEDDLIDVPTRQLLARYSRILVELKRRQVVRTSNAPAGDYAEWLVAKGLGGTLVKNSVKGHDIELPDGTKIQVKARTVSPSRPRIQTSPFRSWDFDQAALLKLSDADYSVIKAVLLPVAVVQSLAGFRPHINGSVLNMVPAVMGHIEAYDLTDELRRIAN